MRFIDVLVNNAIALAVLFMASDEASSIHGARLLVDGGCTAQHTPWDCDV
jgi:hypothetical protein